MNKRLKHFLVGLLTGLIAATGTLAGALSEMPKGGDLSLIGDITWLWVVVFGVSAALKDWKAALMGTNNG